VPLTAVGCRFDGPVEGPFSLVFCQVQIFISILCEILAGQVGHPLSKVKVRIKGSSTEENKGNEGVKR
jgi:hypothetical protein